MTTSARYQRSFQINFPCLFCFRLWQIGREFGLRLQSLPVFGSKGASFRCLMISVIVFVVPFLAKVPLKSRQGSNGEEQNQHLEVSSDKELAPHRCC